MDRGSSNLPCLPTRSVVGVIVLTRCGLPCPGPSQNRCVPVGSARVLGVRLALAGLIRSANPRGPSVNEFLVLRRREVILSPQLRSPPFIRTTDKAATCDSI